MNIFCRRLIECYAPFLVSTYRSAKSEWTFCRQKPYLTPFGFKLIGRSDMQQGKFEPEETKFMIKTFKNVDVFVDIGANIDYYTCLARSFGIKTVAVEPLVENQRYLYANILENGWEDVEVWPLALSSKQQLAELYGGGDWCFPCKWLGKYVEELSPFCSLFDLGHYSRQTISRPAVIY